MEKEKFYTYHRHGVAYRAPITPGMTKEMMKKIYKVPSGDPWEKLDEKDMTYIRFPETTYTMMTQEDYSANWEIMKGKIKKEEGAENE